jgi:protocatechuate 3,4-dioxygenase beta subunit
MQLLSLLAASSWLAPRAAVAAPACTLAPAMSVGPYWVDQKLNRSDLTAGTARESVLSAVPMTLAIYVQGTMGEVCSNVPAAGIQVDIWHGDVNGEYSDVTGMDQANTRGEDFLRGYQVSDAEGRVLFNTVYPGWYERRTPHIHARARVYDAAGNVTYNYVTQLFFDDAFTDTVYARPPYNARGARSTRNGGDGAYRDSAMPPLLTLTHRSDGH